MGVRTWIANRGGGGVGVRGVSAGVGLMVSPASVLGSSFPRFPHLRRHLVMFSQSLWNISSRSSDYPVSGKCPMLSWLENVFPGKICSKCGAESSPARLWLPAAGGGRAWAARTGSGPMWMCGDILAAARLWRGRLLTTGRLSCRHPIIVCARRVGRVAVAGRSVAWACSGRGAVICVRVFSSVSHL